MQKFELKNRYGLKIVGDLEKPEGEIRGTCVLLHGWGAHRNKPTILAVQKGFLEAGFQVFNFDATNSMGESDGDFEKSSMMTFWEDFEDVTKWVQTQEWFVGPLALSGHSNGAYAALRYGEEHPTEVGYIVPIAPVVSGKLSHEAYEERDPEGLKEWKETGIWIRETSDGNKQVAHWWQMEERLNHDLFPKAGNLAMPILFIVGNLDDLCPPKHIKQLFDKMPEGNKKMEIIEGAEHSFRKTEEQEECTRLIKEWLK